MIDKLTDQPVTVVLILTFLVAAVTGAILTITGDLTYSQLLDDLKGFAGALGILGIGRGVNAGLTARAQAIQLQNIAAADATDTASHPLAK